MSEHLPECIYEPEQWDIEQSIVWGNKPCICAALRACEQRVREDDKNTFLRAAYDTGREDGVQAARDEGYSAALDKAKDLIDAVLHTDPCDCDTCRGLALAISVIEYLQRTDRKAKWQHHEPDCPNEGNMTLPCDCVRTL